jgi:5-methylcytosine-specific restriction endonuclease McrA
MGRPRYSNYSIGDITKNGNIILEIRKRPDKIRNNVLEGDGYEFNIRCGLCNDPSNDRWVSKVADAKGCRACYNAKQRFDPNTDSTYKILKTSIQHGAKRRGYSYELSFDQYKDIVTRPCYWCGIEPPLKNPKGERMPTLPAPAHGIDRLDNAVGYIYNNCVASCQICNVAKNNSSVADFRSWIEKIYLYQFQEVVA